MTSRPYFSPLLALYKCKRRFCDQPNLLTFTTAKRRYEKQSLSADGSFPSRRSNAADGRGAVCDAILEIKRSNLTALWKDDHLPSKWFERGEAPCSQPFADCCPAQLDFGWYHWVASGIAQTSVTPEQHSLCLSHNTSMASESDESTATIQSPAPAHVSPTSVPPESRSMTVNGGGV